MIWLRVISREEVRGEQVNREPVNPQPYDPAEPYRMPKGPFRSVVQRRHSIRVSFAGCEEDGTPADHMRHYVTLDLSPAEAEPFGLDTVWVLGQLVKGAGPDA